nr:hypothetical protein GCM10025730_36170 [Promicromonospora thailandica]
MQGLADRLEHGLGVEPEQRADARSRGRAEVRHVVDLVLVQADRADQVHLDLVAGHDAPDQLGAGAARVLRDGQDRRDVVARVGVLGGEEGVVEVELPDGDAVRPGGPLGAARGLGGQAEHGGPRRVGVRLGLRPGGDGGTAREAGRGDGGVVDDAVDHHVGDLGRRLDGVGGELRELPRELVGALERFRGGVDAEVVRIRHGDSSSIHRDRRGVRGALDLLILRVLGTRHRPPRAVSVAVASVAG